MSQWQVRKEKTSQLWAENLQSYGNQVELRRRLVPQPTESLRNQAKEPRWNPTAQVSANFPITISSLTQLCHCGAKAVKRYRKGVYVAVFQ